MRSDIRARVRVREIREIENKKHTNRMREKRSVQLCVCENNRE